MTNSAELGDAAWLKTGEVARLLALLDRDGEEARVVGGAVRNALLHLPVAEIDVATTALPEDVVRRVAAAGWKAVPTGIEHGTITVVIDGKPFEVTTLRRDVETYGRKAKVAFGRDWATDAQRRDFTINALSAAADGKVYDYVGGIADIAARHVRFIGEAQQRIAEDYLRILRFFRFHAWYGHGAPDAAGLHACIRARGGLEMLSRERVRMELLKLLLAPHAAPTLAVMAETGILGTVLGGVPLLASFENMVKVEAAAGIEAAAVRRLGALGVYLKEDAERLGQRLRLANAEAERLIALDRWWRVSPAHGDQAAHALLYHLGPQSFADRVLVAWARSDADANDDAWRKLAGLPQRWTAPVFPLKAADFIRRGIAAGPALGAALRAAEEAWIATDFPVDTAAINAIAERAATKEPNIRQPVLSQERKLFDILRHNLVRTNSRYADREVILCPTCLREMTLDDVQSVEHIIPRNILRHDPEFMRTQSLSRRAGLTILCRHQRETAGGEIAPQGCNGWKGQVYDRLFAGMVQGREVSESELDHRHGVAILIMAYLGAFQKFGYEYILRPELDPIRQQFDFPDRRITSWLDKSQVRLPSQDPNFQIWATSSGLPFVFGGATPSAAPLEVFFRRFRALLPSGHWTIRNAPAILLPAMIEPSLEVQE